jgi:serine/threonine-protein kinase RsbT
VNEIGRVAVSIAGQNDILKARTAGRDRARALGFSTVDQTRLATAISELARNALAYGGGGVCAISSSANPDGSQTIRVVVEDHGPGIGDLALAFKPGFSTGGGLGLGLPGVRRLMDDLVIESAPGRTIVETTMSRGP